MTVGRIETQGMVLVDLQEAMELMGKSRITIFRQIKAGNLIQVYVHGDPRLYVTLDSIERYRHGGPQIKVKLLENTAFPEDDTQRRLRDREIRKRFPHFFKSRPDPPQMAFPFLDQPPSSEE